MRVLIVKTSSMGDVLHTLPALTDAAQALPDVRFDWVVEEAFSEIPRWHANVNQVIPVAIRRWRKSWFSQKTRQERRAFIQTLQATHYDAIIDAQGLLKSAFLITRHAMGTSHGLDWNSAREPLASLFYNKKHSIAKNQHAVERIRQLFAQSLGYTLPPSQGDYGIAAHFNASIEAAAAPYLVFLHATTRDNKHWPEEHWQALIKTLASTEIEIKLPWGSQTEQQRAQRLAQGYPHVTVMPKSTLTTLANTLAHAKAIISVDTGLSHLAAALDKTNITLFGPTDPGLIGGYGKNQYPMKASTNRMEDNSVDDVFTKLSLLIKMQTSDKPL